jgi:hypothetical protein
MEARLVREELEKCQKGEGVNHYENCKWLADKYITMLKENRVRPFFSLCIHLRLFPPPIFTVLFFQVKGYKMIDI